jgi:hypothetical protein
MREIEMSNDSVGRRMTVSYPPVGQKGADGSAFRGDTRPRPKPECIKTARVTTSARAKGVDPGGY